MSIKLVKLSATGPGREPATIDFDELHTLVRGPSDTGKSYIRDCLWYLLGGDKAPKIIPEMEGYDRLELAFQSGERMYNVHRALIGGAIAVYAQSVVGGEQTALQEDLGELLVELSGAAGRRLLRNRTEKGPVTGDDLRHWTLVSQPTVLSEDATAGVGFAVTKHISSFNLFLTGNDDEAIELLKSTAEVERIKGQLGSAEDNLKRVQAGLPPDADREQAAEALERVDALLDAMTTQHEARASRFKRLREDIATSGTGLAEAEMSMASAASLVERFKMLDQKYSSDLARLGATDEGIAFFNVLSKTECPLCGMPVESQVNPEDLKRQAPESYRKAIAAEAKKIHALREGLRASLATEQTRLSAVTAVVSTERAKLKALEKQEIRELSSARDEYSYYPRQLAESHTKLSSILGVLDEVERLTAEIERLKKAKVQTRVKLSRTGGTHGEAVAQISKDMLAVWGFTNIKTVSLDAAACDLIIDGRARLSYGAGKRALFLTAMTVALMKHALESGPPHLGVVVVDSPLKAYADPKSARSDNDIATKTVTDNFYNWLSTWSGAGQIVILENEPIQETTAAVLKPIEFTGPGNLGRQGFFPAHKV